MIEHFRSLICRLNEFALARRANSQDILCGIAVGLVAAWIGYAIGTNRSKSPGPDATSTLEQYACSQTFSEVENARSFLRNLAMRAMTDLRIRTLIPLLRIPHGTPGRDEEVARALREIRDTIQEFRGSGEEMILIRDFLSFLKREHLYAEWINEYLSLAYTHPSSKLVQDLAPEAKRVAEIIGRGSELTSALSFMGEIPSETLPTDPIIVAANEPSPGDGVPATATRDALSSAP